MKKNTQENKNTVTLEAINETHFNRIIQMNQQEVQHTSPIDDKQLRLLLGLSAYSRIATIGGKIGGKVTAFIIALREHAAYNNTNYTWFASRFDTFLYIDRIVVDANYSKQGMGQQLYRDLFSFACAHNIHTITCEYNIEPYNVASAAFHKKLGFIEVDTQELNHRSKKVSLQVLAI